MDLYPWDSSCRCGSDSYPYSCEKCYHCRKLKEYRTQQHIKELRYLEWCPLLSQKFQFTELSIHRIVYWQKYIDLVKLQIM